MELLLKKIAFVNANTLLNLSRIIFFRVMIFKLDM